jgi:hypothetical protein
MIDDRKIDDEWMNRLDIGIELYRKRFTVRCLLT